MVGLIDIAPRIETVDVQGAYVTVHDISAKGAARLLGQFPELRTVTAPASIPPKSSSLDCGQLSACRGVGDDAA